MRGETLQQCLVTPLESDACHCLKRVIVDQRECEGSSEAALKGCRRRCC
jgi:hypothetical protein